jgi:hypothetical protein
LLESIHPGRIIHHGLAMMPQQRCPLLEHSLQDRDTCSRFQRIINWIDYLDIIPLFGLECNQALHQILIATVDHSCYVFSHTNRNLTRWKKTININEIDCWKFEQSCPIKLILLSAFAPSSKIPSYPTTIS